MTAHRSFRLAAVLLACVAAPCARADEWGTIKGKFVFKGDAPAAVELKADKDVEVCGKEKLFAEELVVGADNGIRNVVVFVRDKDVKVNPEVEKATKANPVEIDNKGCRFEPHVVFVQTGQELVIKNSDTVGHNSNVTPLKNSPSNSLIPAGGSSPVKFSVEEPLPAGVTCNIHPWMKAWVVVRGNPYAAVTKADGSFEIAGVPVGDIELQLWHEKAGNLAEVATAKGKADKKGRLKVKVEAAGTDLGDIPVEAAAFKK
jgi:plastocyanin